MSGMRIQFDLYAQRDLNLWSGDNKMQAVLLTGYASPHWPWLNHSAECEAEHHACLHQVESQQDAHAAMTGYTTSDSEDEDHDQVGPCHTVAQAA